MEKKGQVTIFIIVAIVIIVAGVLVYFFLPGIRSGLVSDEENPPKFLQTCLEDRIEEVVQQLSDHGGSMNPEHYIIYEGDNIEYLCYTEEYYEACVVQQPLLGNHISKEIEREIKENAESCFDEMEQKYQNDGYTVDLKRGDMNIELLPKRVIVNFENSLNLAKGGQTNSYERFRVVLNNNLYELISIATSIIEWETRYGDAETTVYMTYYKDLKVEKKNQIEGSTIYILTDRNNENKFQFASRSMPLPPGY